MLLSQVRQMASYSAWANTRLYDAVARLSPEEVAAPRSAFFGSILGTLNHLLVGDILWLDRLEGRSPRPDVRLDTILHDTLPALRDAHLRQTEAYRTYVAGLDEATLAGTLVYRTIDGTACTTPTAVVLTHVVNHGTHHRAQVHGLLSQTAVAPPPLDLIYFWRETQAAS